MSFWGDFDLIRKYVVSGRFSKFNSKKCHFGEIFGYQERPKFLLYTKIKKNVILGIQEFQLTVHKRKCHYGEIRALYLFNHENSGERIAVHILKPVMSTATAIRNLDSKHKNVILERFWGHNFLTIRIIL